MASSSEFGERLGRLTPEQRRLLELKLRRDRNPLHQEIPKRLDSGSARLSSAQMRMWLFCQRHPGSFVYHTPRVFEIEGPLDDRSLTEALWRMVERYEALRTVILEREGHPVQVIQPAGSPGLPVVDLDAGEVEAWIRRETEQPIDLAVGPLFRAMLARIGVERHVLLMVWHHIVSDLRSSEVLDEELGGLYAGHQLPEPRLQYGDYAEWERARASGSDGTDSNAFWKEYLTGAPPLIDLRCGRPRAAEQRFAGRLQTFELESDLVGQIGEFGLAHHVPLFPVFLAAYGVLMSRYSSREDFVVGVPASGRDAPELDRAVGYFVDMLPIRLVMSGGTGFAEVVRQCRSEYVMCSRHSLPFDAILAAVSPPRSPSYSPLFQVALNYLKDNGARLDLAGAKTERVPFHNGTSMFDLTLTVSETRSALGGLPFTIEYNSDLFDAPLIRRMGGHLINILREATGRHPTSATAAPAILPPVGPKPATIAGIEMLSADERQEILEKRSGSEEPLTLQKTILTWFERHRALHPEAPAVCSGSLVWDYGELDAFANRVRDAIEERGVRPGDVVAVDAARSPQTVGAILGIWKCGAVWLPLDPRWPEDRSQFAIDDSGTKLVIDSAWLNHNLRSEALARPSAIAGEFVAYVLYTSGSTGRPKGVAVRHASLANFLRSMGRQPGLTGEDTLFSVTPLTFDISLNEVFLPLSMGARVILPDLDAATDPLQVRRLLEEYPVTVMQATPVMWRSLIDAGWKGSSRLRAWCGGENIPPELAEQLVGRVGELWNLYGPTETTIWSTVHRVTRVESPVPIGRPIANTQCYVLDSGLEPVPDGVAGDLYLGGAGLAAGYIGHASSATDQSFIPNPFVPGARMYRTGDIARWSEAGELIFLRRNDAQVKVRGHRIELDEVKAALRGCANVRDVAVVARADSLAAYVVPEAASLWDPKQVRRDLRARLPEYMVPAVFVCMESLPLTANGKIDLKMLPDSGPDPPPVLEDSALPRNLLEERLQGIWEELLGIHPVGRQDDFFALGGHSLLAAGLFAHIEETFSRQMPISTLFRAPTIELLAAAIRETGHRLMWSQVVPIQTGDNRPALFCLPPENALSFRAFASALGEGYPLYSLQPPGLDGEDTPEASVEGLALRAIEAMRSVQPKGPYFLCGFSFGGYTAYEMACQLIRAGEGVTIAIIDSDLLILPSYWRSLSRSRRMRYLAQRTTSYTKGLFIGTAADREWFRASVKKMWRYRILGKPNVREEDGARLSSAARRVRAAREMAFHRYAPRPCTVNMLFVQSRGMPSKSWDADSHGWKGLVKGEVSIVGVAGADHISIVADPFVGQLGAALRDWMSAYRK